MTKKRKLLLVEDDSSMGFLLVDFLESNGFDVTLCNDGTAGWKAFEKGRYDMCVLDLMLPGMDGFSIAERIRKKDVIIPIIFLTARSMKQDKMKGFGLGIDDYITKPFDEDELLCRIKAVLSRLDKSQLASQQNQLFNIGKYTFDPANQSLAIDGDHRRLTTKESQVLGSLCHKMNNIVKRDDILYEIWGNNDYFNGRSLDVFIAKLRKYLKKDTSIIIENIPKIGYVLNTNADS